MTHRASRRTHVSSAGRAALVTQGSTGIRRWFIGACLIVVLLLAASRWNPLMTSAANNRLEAPCADPAIAGVEGFDRAAWTPLLWSCTVQRMDGRTETIRPW
jgi:hypothetical protein